MYYSEGICKKPHIEAYARETIVFRVFGLPPILPVVRHRGKQLRHDVHSPTPHIGRRLYEVRHRAWGVGEPGCEIERLRGHAIIQMHVLTAETSVDLMERANAVLAELQAQFCTIQDVKFSWTGGGAAIPEMEVLILYDTPVDHAVRPEP